MSSLLVNIATSATGAASGASFADVPGLAQSTVAVGSGTSILLMIATVPQALSAGDDGFDLQFAVDDVLEGPIVSYFKDEASEGCAASICWATTATAGNHKFAVQWRTRSSAAQIDTGRVRSLSVIEITDASLLVNLTSVATDDAVAGYTDVVGLSSTQTVTTGAVHLVLGNMTQDDSGIDNTVVYRLAINDAGVGGELSSFGDAANEVCGNSLMWLTSGLTGSTKFALQWDEDQATIVADTGRTRSLQVIEITANANVLANQTSVSAWTGTAAYTDVTGMSATVNVDSTDSILLFAGGVTQVRRADDTGVYRFYESTTGEGPEMYIFNDTTNEGCGHSLYWATNGKATGSHIFSMRGQNIQSIVNADTGLARYFCILELTAAGGATTMTADAGSYAHTGVATPFAFGMPVVAGGYTHTGQTASTVRGRPIVASAGSYTYTGQATPFKFGMPVTAGSYTETGATASTVRGRPMIASAGSYTYAGIATPFAIGMPVTAGGYTHTGQAVTTTRAVSTTALAASYTYSGESIPFAIGMPVTAGVYTHTGVTATTTRAVSTTASAGTYTYTGQVVTTTYSSGPAEVLTALAGSYTYTGQVVTFAFAMPATAGTYTYSGASVPTQAAYNISALVGTYIYTGNEEDTYYRETVEKLALLVDKPIRRLKGGLYLKL